ncbi:hypothetical protein J6590_061229 [Homalodisca vitripennis]|nr:hypothetical protein J6590_061229 [Homalodisca vitripennis]
MLHGTLPKPVTRHVLAILLPCYYYIVMARDQENSSKLRVDVDLDAVVLAPVCHTDPVLLVLTLVAVHLLGHYVQPNTIHLGLCTLQLYALHQEQHSSTRTCVHVNISRNTVHTRSRTESNVALGQKHFLIWFLCVFIAVDNARRGSIPGQLGVDGSCRKSAPQWDQLPDTIPYPGLEEILFLTRKRFWKRVEKRIAD